MTSPLQQNISMSLNQALYFGQTVKRAKRVLTHDFSRFPQNWQKLLRASLSVPLEPEAFHARFPVFFSPFVPSAKGRRRVCLRPTKLLVAREKNLWYPGWYLRSKVSKSQSKRSHTCVPKGTCRAHAVSFTGKEITMVIEILWVQFPFLRLKLS